MHAISFTVGSAAAGAIAQQQALEHREDFDAYRTLDLIKMGFQSASQAVEILSADPAETRACLIHGASRLLAAADRLDPAAPPANVFPLGAA